MQRRVITAATDALLSVAEPTRREQAREFGFLRSPQHLRQDYKHLRDAMSGSIHL